MMKRDDSGMKRNSNASARPIVSPSTPISSDPGILAFGTSVSVNDDLRRNIASEIQDIESTCAKIKDEVNLESKVQGELDKTKVHTQNELAELSRGASDAVDTLNMNTQILIGLKNTMEIEITQYSDQHASQKNDSSKIVTPNGDGVDSFFKQGQEKRSNELIEIQTNLSSKLNHLRDIRSKRKDSENLIERIVKNNETVLEVELAKIQEHNVQSKNEIDIEKKRILKVNESISVVRDNIDKISEMIKSKQSEIDSQARSFAEAETEKHKILSGIKDKISSERQTVQSLEEESVMIQAEVDKFQKLVFDARSLISERETKKIDLQKRVEENRELIAEEQRIAQEIAYFQELINKDRHAILELEKERSNIEAMKQANDTTEVEKIIPGRAEFNELQLENEKIDSFLESSMDCSEIKRLQEEIVSVKTSNDDLEKEISSILKAIEDKKSMKIELQKSIDDLNESNSNEIRGMSNQLEEVLKEKDEIQRLIADKKIAITRFSEEKQENHAKLENELPVLKRKHDVLRYGKKLLDKTASKTKSILEGAKSEQNEKEASGGKDLIKSDVLKKRKTQSIEYGITLKVF